MDGNERPECDLIGTDGNVFALAGRVTKALKRAGMGDKATEFTQRLFACGSYDEALVLMGEYVEIR
jgi:hypothetical protein